MELVLCCIIIGCVVVATLFLFFRLHRKRRKQMGSIENTQNVIVSIREIAELTTASFFTETVEEKRKRKKGADGKVGDLLDRVGADYAINDVICIIVRGVVHAGYNLKHIKEEDFRYADGKLTIQLPPVEILNIIVNPTDCDPYMQHGHWSFAEITEIEANAKNKIKDEAIAAHLLEQASKNGEKQIRALFLGLGYKDIELLQQQQTAQCAIVE